MNSFILLFLPYLTLFSHIVFVVLVGAIIYRRGWGRSVFSWLGKYSIYLSFILAIAAIVGSLFYSEVLGYEPCVLCWWIRVFLYPLAVIFAVALWKRRSGREAFSYAMPLILGGFLVSLYYSYYSLGGISLLSCTAEGGGCNQIFVKEFRYITIPMMSLTLTAYMLLLAWVNKLAPVNNKDKIE